MDFIFENKQLRTVPKNEEVWFVAKDVCEILGFRDPYTATRGLDDDEKLLHTLYVSGQNRETTIINEPGLYSLILRSNKPEAKQFKRWITHEVLPVIRKTGGFVANDELFIQTYLSNADEETKLMFRSTLATVRKLNQEKAIMQPKAEYFDALVDRNLLTNFRDTAKELHIKQNIFVNWLLDKKYIYRDQKGKLKPYSSYVPELFQLKDWERNGKTDVQTLITPKGKETFRILINKLVS